MTTKHANRQGMSLTGKTWTRNTLDEKGNLVHQHVLWRVYGAFQVWRWDAATVRNTLVEEFEFHGLEDEIATREMAKGALNHMHRLAQAGVIED